MINEVLWVARFDSKRNSLSFLILAGFLLLTRGVNTVSTQARDIKKSAHTRCIHCEAELKIEGEGEWSN